MELSIARLTRRREPAQRAPVPPDLAAPRSPPAWGAALALMAAVLLAYQDCYDAPFVFDDVSAIAENPTLRSLTAAWSPPVGGSLTVEGRPLLNFSFALNRQLTGTAPAGYRAVNVAIHALAALLLFGIVRRTLAGAARPAAWRVAAGPAALVTALAWALHPLQTESVTYVVQRAESLMGCLYLGALYAFIRACARPPGWGWLALAASGVLAATGVKEVVATAPVLLLLYDRTFVAGSFAGAWAVRRGFYLALAATWVPLALQVADGGGNRSGIMGFGIGVGWWAYVTAQGEAVVRYLGLAVWPSPLVFEYGAFQPRPWLERLPWLAVAGPLLAATVAALRWRPVAGFAGAAFFLLLAPTSLVPSTTQLIVEHRLYLPLAAVLAGVVVAVLPRCMAEGRGRVVLAGAAAGFAALLVLTMARNRTYASEVALWRDTVAKRPGNALAHHVLAEALERTGALDEALRAYTRATELRPEFILAYGGRARLLARSGRAAEAQAAAKAALTREPGYAPAHEVLALLAADAGRAEESVGHWRGAMAAAPGDDRLRLELAAALSRSGRDAEAEALYLALRAERPENVRAHFDLANLLRRLGRMPEAMDGYRATIRLQPDHFAAHNNLANALAATGGSESAVAHYRAALRDPAARAEVHHNLALTLLRMGRRVEAAAEFAAALQVNPRFVPAQAALEELGAAGDSPRN